MLLRPARLLPFALLAILLSLPPHAQAQGPVPRTKADKQAPKPLPDCTHCKEKLQTLEALRAQLPADWSLATEREPVFGGDVLVVQAGRAHAQTVLLVHGLGQNGFTDWLPVMPWLAKRYHVLTIDLPGHGYSTSPLGKYSPHNYARVLQWLLSKHARGAPVVVGHSMGAAVALRLAHEHAASVGRLVLVDAAGILHRAAYVKHQAALPLSVEGVPGALKEQVARIQELGGVVVERMFGMPNDPTRFLRQYDIAWEVLLRNRADINAALAMIDEDFSAAVHTLKQPTHLIWGEVDTVAPLRTGRVLARRLPNAQLHVIPGVGHSPMLTATDDFLARLNLALTTEPAPAAAPAHAPRDAEDLVCKDLSERQYSGRYRAVRIESCSGVRLTNLSADRLVIRNSIVQMTDVRVQGTDVALDVENSEVVATASDLSGEVAVRADASRLDFAGVSLLALAAAVDVRRRSRLIASVSDVRSPEYNGYWHDFAELEETRLAPRGGRE
jgi:pimeloyl-ACP methyl ester carboxylesterase